MESLGISTDDVWTLFLLIDKDDDGLVDIEQSLRLIEVDQSGSVMGTFRSFRVQVDGVLMCRTCLHVPLGHQGLLPAACTLVVLQSCYVGPSCGIGTFVKHQTSHCNPSGTEHPWFFGSAHSNLCCSVGRIPARRRQMFVFFRALFATARTSRPQNPRQLRGPAKSLQVAKMSYENRITRASKSVASKLNRIMHDRVLFFWVEKRREDMEDCRSSKHVYMYIACAHIIINNQLLYIICIGCLVGDLPKKNIVLGAPIMTVVGAGVANFG